MKANELMIGDWIRIDEPDKYAGATGQIQSLMYHREGDAAYFHVFIQGKFGFVSRDVCSDDIRPITLTPEILEKNGFEWTTRKSYMVSCIGTVRMIWGFYKDCLSISDHSDDGGCQISSLKCKFVHQLQNALKLCEIEKEIIL